MEKKKLFENIAGYDGIKEELMNIYGWYKDKELLNSKDVNLPRGILFCGEPGNGKTLFIREYSKALDCPSYSITGDNKDVCKEITETFAKARKNKFALILIDEMDLLIGKDSQILRVLQSELDGLNKNGNVLVLATTNSRRLLPSALIRPGRFDRLINVDAPRGKEVMQIYKFWLEKLHVDMSNIDLVHIERISRRMSCASIKTVVNDAYLRGKTKLTTKDLEIAREKAIVGDYTKYDPLEYRNYRIAIHEAGHAVMGLRFGKHYHVYNAKFCSSGGYTTVYENNNLEDSIEKRLEQIQISLSGPLAERVFFKRHDVGSVIDIDRAQDYCSRLIERTCYNGFGDYVTPIIDNNRPDTNEHHRRTEKATYKILKKQEKDAYRYLKKHKKEIRLLADCLYTKGEITSDDIHKLLNIDDYYGSSINKRMIPQSAIAYTSSLEDNNSNK
ncbi:MAG: AAA family ATPase [Bacilli bacterium]|nr:AAA family ATPase [Bacilli bacterium]